MSAEGGFEENEFEGTSSGASQTVPMQCSGLRKNGHVMIKGHPCKIVDMSTSKTGKHGHAKVHLVGIDIFTGKKYEDICPSTHNMDVPNVKREEYMLLGCFDGFLSLMSDDPTKGTRDDLKCPEGELGEQILADLAAEKDLLCTVLTAVGIETVVNVKVNTAADK